MTPALEVAITSVIDLLVRREYVALATMTNDRRLNATMLAQAVQNYGRTLVLPPGRLPPDLEVVQDKTNGRQVHAVMSMWTEEEGQSDLGLELTLTEIGDGIFDTRVDDLRVL